MAVDIDAVMQILLDQSRELRTIRQMCGGFGEALRQGHEVMRRQSEDTQALARRVTTIETRQETSGTRKSKLAEWTEFGHVYWPYVALGVLVGAKLVLGSAEPAMHLIEHLGGKG